MTDAESPRTFHVRGPFFTVLSSGICMQAIEKARSCHGRSGWIVCLRDPARSSDESARGNSNGSGRRRLPLAVGGRRSPLNRLIFLFATLLCLGLLTVTPPAAAHVRINSISHAILAVNGETLNYYIDLPPTVLKLLHDNIGEATADLSDYFGMETKVTTWDRDCPLARVTPSAPLPSGNRIFDLQFHCPRSIGDLTVMSALFLDLDGGHTQFARLVAADDPHHVLHEAVLSEANEQFHVADVQTGGSVSLERALAFLKLGIMHLLTGYDHILFLLTVVVGISFMESLKAVTSFTLAHSLTMALAVLGAISLSSAIVEPLIAATIIYVAFENVTNANIRRRWIWTFFFGLIHGLGFVDALKRITVSQHELILSLVSFNFGIEVGQLIILSAAVLALRYVKRFPWYSAFNRSFSAGVGVLGFVWLGQRLLAT